MAVTESSSGIAHGRGLVAFAESDADGTVVWLRGDHDASTVGALSLTLARALALDGADLVVDLSEVEFMGSATVTVVVGPKNFSDLGRGL